LRFGIGGTCREAGRRRGRGRLEKVAAVQAAPLIVVVLSHLATPNCAGNMLLKRGHLKETVAINAGMASPFASSNRVAGGFHDGV
jgi:hypothetical protein